MKLSFGFLIMYAALASIQNPGMVKGSTSPDSQYSLVVTRKTDGIYYHVQEKSGVQVSQELKSDFGLIRPLEEACANTSVHWRPDGKFVVAFTGHDRHHVDFFILRKTTTGFEAVPFDSEVLTEFAALKPLGFVYPAFVEWLPNGHASVDLFEFDGRSTIRESIFDLDLTGQATPVSWKIVKPEQQIKNS